MNRSRESLSLKLISGAIIALLILMALSLPSRSDSAQASQEFIAPQPLSPENGAMFVETDEVVLDWEWSSELPENQIFVVHLWVAEEPAREVWTKESNLNAQELIDSFGYEIGNFQWKVAVVQFSAEAGFEKMISEWSETQDLERVRRVLLEPYPESEQSDLAKYINAQQPATKTEIIHRVRDIIHTNTVQSHKEILDDFLPDYSDALTAIYAHMQGKSAAPLMLCNGMTTAALTLFLELGIESRLVFLYGQVPGYIAEHTMLEVFNPDTQYWELHDVGSNLYFVEESTGNRAPIERLVFGSLDDIVACDSAGNCSAELLEPLEQYFHAFRYGYTDPTVWVNPDRFDVTTRFPAFDNKNLAEYLSSNPRDLIFRFDSWQ